MLSPHLIALPTPSRAARGPRLAADVRASASDGPGRPRHRAGRVPAVRPVPERAGSAGAGEGASPTRRPRAPLIRPLARAPDRPPCRAADRPPGRHQRAGESVEPDRAVDELHRAVDKLRSRRVAQWTGRALLTGSGARRRACGHSAASARAPRGRRREGFEARRSERFRGRREDVPGPARGPAPSLDARRPRRSNRRRTATDPPECGFRRHAPTPLRSVIARAANGAWVGRRCGRRRTAMRRDS